MLDPKLWLRCLGTTALVLALACDSDSSSEETDGGSGGVEGSGDASGGGASQTGAGSTATSGAATSGTATSGDPTTPGSTDTSDSACGNGVLDPGEACDGELGIDTSCAELGYVAGDLLCSADCTALDESQCSDTAICGDGVVSESEECEEGVSEAGSCGSIGEGDGSLSCLDCGWSVASCCAVECTDGCDNSCGGDATDLTGQWEILFFNNGWQGPDPIMQMDLVQDGTSLSGSFTTDAWYLGDQEFEGGERSGNDVYMHVPIEQLSGGMIMEGTVCGGCSMVGYTDPQGGLNSDWVATRVR